MLLKESQSALVAGGVVSLKFYNSQVFRDFAQVMLLIGSMYHNPEASKVLFGKTAVRDSGGSRGGWGDASPPPEVFYFEC